MVHVHPPHILTDQVTLSQPEGTDYALIISRPSYGPVRYVVKISKTDRPRPLYYVILSRNVDKVHLGLHFQHSIQM